MNNYKDLSLELNNLERE